MELLNSSLVSRNSQIVPAIPIYSPKFPTSRWRKKTSPKFTTPNFIGLRFSPSLPLSSASKFRISAHFRQRSNRQNYLRKKLAEEQQRKVSPDPLVSEPSFGSQRTSTIELKFSNLGESWGLDHANEIVEDSNVTSEKGLNPESKLKLLNDSPLLSEFESWVDQYRKDTEFWGVGNDPIFIVFQDSEGKVARVAVDENEILRRSQVEPSTYDGSDEDLAVVNSRISYARALAKEVERGANVLPKNSSVAKFINLSEKLRFVNAIKDFSLHTRARVSLRGAGIMVLCSYVLIWAVKQMLKKWKRPEYTKLEKERLRRKMKTRMEKEKFVKGSVEVIKEPVEPEIMPAERPQLDEQELLNNITRAKVSSHTWALPERSTIEESGAEFDESIQEIRAMARHVREVEKTGTSLDSNSDREDGQTLNDFSNETELVELYENEGIKAQVELNDEIAVHTNDVYGTLDIASLDETEDDTGSTDDPPVRITAPLTSNTSKEKIPDDMPSILEDMNNLNDNLLSRNSLQENARYDTTFFQSTKLSENSAKTKPTIILSVKEAKEYLSKRHEKLKKNQECVVGTVEQFDTESIMSFETSTVGKRIHRLDENGTEFRPSALSETPRPACASQTSISETKDMVLVANSSPGPEKGTEENSVVDPLISNVNFGDEYSNSTQESTSVLHENRNTSSNTITMHNDEIKLSQPSLLLSKPDSTSDPTACGDSRLTNNASSQAKGSNPEDPLFVNLQSSESSFYQEDSNGTAKLAPSIKERPSIKDFPELEPIMKKIQEGFRGNYIIAKERKDEELRSNTEMIQLMTDGDYSELEWMKDERLREIVFRVRDNELAGRDPFHQVDDEDKLAFFSGLERKVDQENEKLLKLHEWIHSHVENLDYGADGIGLYDPPEKVLPRWKGPPVEEIPQFLINLNQRKESVSEDAISANITNDNTQNSRAELSKSPSSDSIPSTIHDKGERPQQKPAKVPKTTIEGSDGSVRAGKKSGKEHWQHTKKWSQGFLDAYNAERDPEIKSIMRNMGKDLDRWITKKDVKDASELMDKVGIRKPKSTQDKLAKIKREVELFGPQAVISKYREYADEKEEDYLWWLDLPYILCIELYTKEGKFIGLYSLEMAAELELDPKQYHVIGFEDACDCKNLCCIIEADQEIIGGGSAIVVAVPPKDAFRDAKAHGFGVTVIRKGEMKLNIDQTLEEVEELIIEIGSKMYHDEIMKERSVDLRAITKGVLSEGRTKRPRSKKTLKNLLKKKRS